jgi:hypothetical protein
MLFGRRGSSRRHAVAVARDIVEVTAIVIAGIWAFYVFAYENRIKPSMADPDVNVTASMQRLSERNGFIAVSLHLELHNVGTVRAHFLGMAVNVYGQRITRAEPRIPRRSPGLQYDFQGFYHTGPMTPVYAWAYVTSLGNPATGQDSFLDPGSTIENDRMFYVPQGQFALLTLGIDAPYTKYENATIPTHLELRRGAAKVVTIQSPKVDRYSIEPVTSLDVR